MRKGNEWHWAPAVIGIAGIVAAGWVLGHDEAVAKRSRRPSVTGALKATAAAPAAEGNFEENVEDGLPDGTTEASGDLKVSAQRLAPKSTYNVKVGQAVIGTLRTNRAGKGRAKFSTTPHGRRTQPLPVDPRGKVLAVANAADDETVLDGAVSDPTTPGGIQCCLNTHDQSGDQQGCDSLLPAECTAAGGVDMGPGTCEPDPCPGANDSAGGADTGQTDGGGTDQTGG